MNVTAGKRVLMLLENCPFPQDRRVIREANTLANGGYQVSVIAPCAEKQSWYELIDGIHVYRFPEPPQADGILGYAIEYSFALTAMFLISLWVLFRRGFDILHTHNPPDAFVFIGLFYKLLGKKYVYDHHDASPELYFYSRFDSEGNKLVYQGLVWLERLSCWLADLVIATNESNKQIEIKRGGAPERHIVVVRNGPDRSWLTPTTPDPELRRKARIILGYAGTIGPQDGIDYLLRAFRHLIDDLGKTDFYCVIMGFGSAWTSMRALATELDLDDYVWFTGPESTPYDDVHRYLSTADICVDPDPSNPYNDRCSMIKMTEYMALGKPIVAFDLPEHRVSAQEAALYAKYNSELEFAAHIAALMDDPERRQAMGEIGRRRVEAGLLWSHQAQQLLRGYAAMLKRPMRQPITTEQQ